MLHRKDSAPLLHNGNGFPILSVGLLVLTFVAPSVFGDIECQCQKSKADLSKRKGLSGEPCNAPDGEVAKCSTGWCFKADYNVETPADKKGKYKEKGCAPAQTMPKCEVQQSADPAAKSRLEVCYCKENRCNYETPPAGTNGLISSSLLLFLSFLFLSFRSVI